MKALNRRRSIKIHAIAPYHIGVNSVYRVVLYNEDREVEVSFVVVSGKAKKFERWVVAFPITEEVFVRIFNEYGPDCFGGDCKKLFCSHHLFDFTIIGKPIRLLIIDLINRIEKKDKSTIEDYSHVAFIESKCKHNTYFKNKYTERRSK